jgi:hypothetical protein
MAKKIRQPKTYALYKKVIYSWVDLLKELDLEHNDNANARPEFYKQASSKQLKAVKCMIKDDEEYIEICNECGKLIDDCTCNNNDVNKYCNDCGELIDNCTCEGDKQDNNENNEYIISNDKKIVTCAQLSNGERIKWVELLRRCGLNHNPRRSAYIEYKEYVSKGVNGLPNIKRVALNSSDVILDKPPIRPVNQNEKLMAWDRYFPRVSEGTCPCCEKKIIYHDCFELGHNKPISKNGTNDIKNLVPLCRKCNGHMSDNYTIVQYKAKYYPNGKIKLLV